jgi:hypothetical protein
MKLRITAQNAYGGGKVDVRGNTRNGVPLLVERILDNDRRPHILLLSDAKGWHDRRHETVYEVADALGMLPLAKATKSGLHTITYYDPDTVKPIGYFDNQADWVYHGMAVCGFDIGLRQPVACIAMHLSAYSPIHATMEAEYMATCAYQYGQLGIVAGDANYPPWHPDNPQPATDTWFAYNRGSRAILTDPYHPFDTDEPNRQVASTFIRKGMVDVAWELYERSGRTDQELLRRTTHDDRIEHCYVTAPFQQAVEQYRVLDMHGERAHEVGAPGAASDHHGVTFLIDTDKIDDTHLTPWR